MDNQKRKWQERLFGKELTDCKSITAQSGLQNVCTVDALKNVEILGVYFCFANINLQSDDFVRKLRDLYDRLNGDPSKNGPKKLEVVQVVLWAHNDVYGDFETSHRDCLKTLPWYGIPYSEIDLKVSFDELKHYIYL